MFPSDSPVRRRPPGGVEVSWGVRSWMCALAGLSGPVAFAAPAYADLRVPSFVGDHMVVQEGRAVRLAGTDAPGTPIRATLGTGQAATRADGAGHWALSLPSVAAGGPFTLTIEGSNRLTFIDIWSGEVWVASGQSNMELALTRSRGGMEASADGCPGLRLFLVQQKTAAAPQPDVHGSWRACEPATADGFSAVAFYFGRQIHRALGVPVGIIQATWGGTPAEAWTPRAALIAEPLLKPAVDAMDLATHDPTRRAELVRKLADWEAKNFQRDTGNRGEALGFARSGGGGDGWSNMDLPQVWENAGLLIDGAVWFRREVVLPPEWAGRDLALSLGAIDDFDVTYWNGERIGATGAETPEYWSAPRNYTIAGHLAKAGRNFIAVRVFDHYGSGGFAGTRAQMTVGPARRGDATAVSLAGTWSYKIERRLEPAVADFSTRPPIFGPDEPTSPSVLWNAMVAPIAGLPVAGVIWYQGENNVGRAGQYLTLFPTMIRAWRAAWLDPALPFLFVQLPNYDVPGASSPLGQSSWAELREAQATALGVPKTAMAVTLDIGEAANLHPVNKEEVGRRLALWALRVAYGRDVIASGPSFVSATREGASALRLRFDPASSGLDTADGAPPKGFIVAGDDRAFHRAVARVDGNSVIVSSPDVANPVAVRYGWGNNPEATLRNQAGLPAAPFRTDAWSTSAPTATR
jgi:sialate O-acetylesterase